RAAPPGVRHGAGRPGRAHTSRRRHEHRPLCGSSGRASARGRQPVHRVRAAVLPRRRDQKRVRRRAVAVVPHRAVTGRAREERRPEIGCARRGGAQGGSLLPEIWTTGIAWPGVVERASGGAGAGGSDAPAAAARKNPAAAPRVAPPPAAGERERTRPAPAAPTPGTPPPAVTAAAAVTLQAASAGRFVLGIGRGDSALA